MSLRLFIYSRCLDLLRYSQISPLRNSVWFSTSCTGRDKKKTTCSLDPGQTAHSGPLSGYRILDLTRVLAGPYCSMILGDLGAEVIKVERPGIGDDTRAWGPPFVGSESCYFLCVNRNKKSICVDLKTPRGKEIIHSLAKVSDVFIENYIPGKLTELGLDYETLSEISPGLIYCSITGYGPTGPYSQRAGYDVIAASLGGLLHITGPIGGGEPCKVGVAITDVATGLYAHGAIMAAILERQRTGKGQKIDCNLLSTQVSCLINLGYNYLNSGKEAVRWGTAHESIVPYESFPTADGYVTVGAGNNGQFATLCKRLGLEELLKDSRYVDNQSRVKNRRSLLSTLSECFSKKKTSNWLELFEGAGFPYGPLNNMAGVFSDPQVLHNKMITEMQHPAADKIRLISPAVQYSQSENKVMLPPPTLGQHTDEVLSDVLDYDKEQLKQLRSQEIIS